MAGTFLALCLSLSTCAFQQSGDTNFEQKAFKGQSLRLALAVSASLTRCGEDVTITEIQEKLNQRKMPADKPISIADLDRVYREYGFRLREKFANIDVPDAIDLPVGSLVLLGISKTNQATEDGVCLYEGKFAEGLALRVFDIYVPIRVLPYSRIQFGWDGRYLEVCRQLSWQTWAGQFLAITAIALLGTKCVLWIWQHNARRRINVSILMLMAMAMYSTPGCKTNSSTIKLESRQAVLEAVPASVNLGRIHHRDRRVVDFEFLLTNISNEHVNIDRIVSSCTCLVEPLQPGEDLLSPGQRRQFSGAIDTAGQAGPRTIFVTIYPKSRFREVVVKLDYEVIPVPQHISGNLSFSYSALHQEIEAARLLFAFHRQSDAPPLKLDAGRSQLHGFRVTPVSLNSRTIRENPGGLVEDSLLLEFAWPPDGSDRFEDKGPDGRQGVLVVAWESGSQCEVPFQFELVDDVTALPTRIFAGRFAPGDSFSREVALKSEFQKDIQVNSISIQGDTFAELETEHPGPVSFSDRMSININTVVKDQAGIRDIKLLVRFADPRLPELVVPFRFEVIDSEQQRASAK